MSDETGGGLVVRDEDVGGLGFRVGREREFEKFTEVGETAAEVFPIGFTCFDEGGKFFELLASYGRLWIEWLQVVAEVTINVLVIVTFRQFAQLPAEAFTAGVVHAARAPA